MGKATDLTTNERESLGYPIRPERTPEEIEADIIETRMCLEGTVDEIKERFSSEHVRSQVRDATIGKAKRAIRKNGERAKQMGLKVMENVKTSPITRKIRSNPVPAAVLGMSLGALIVYGLRRWRS